MYNNMDLPHNTFRYKLFIDDFIKTEKKQNFALYVYVYRKIPFGMFFYCSVLNCS